MTGILYLPIGIPGSGKSYFGSEHFESDEIVSMDHYRRICTGNTSDQSANGLVGVLVNSITKIRLERGLDVYFDATNLQEKYWPHVDRSRIVVIWMTTSNALARQRNAERSRVVPDHAMDRMIERYENLRKFLPSVGLIVTSTGFDRAVSGLFMEVE